MVGPKAGAIVASLGQSQSSNAFKTVIDIDLIGTHNMSLAAFQRIIGRHACFSAVLLQFC